MDSKELSIYFKADLIKTVYASRAIKDVGWTISVSLKGEPDKTTPLMTARGKIRVYKSLDTLSMDIYRIAGNSTVQVNLSVDLAEMH